MIPDLLRRVAGNAVAGDPYYSAVSLLLHFNGANGSTTFTDSSSNNLTVTPTNATISTTQSKFGGAAGYYNGSAYCTAPTGSLFQFSGDFTIEFWVYPTSSSTFTLFDSRINETAPNGNGFVIGINASAQWVVYYGGNQIVGSTVTTNAWTHVAVTRSGTSVKMFLNGTQTGSTWTTSVNFSDGAFLIGTDYPKNARFFNGYIEEFRVTNGVARTITVPSAPYPDRIGSIEADAYFPQTSLLLHMDGTNASTSFVDSGPNALAVTASGNAQISTAQSKFGGASGAFDGTGDYLTATLSALGTGDFTIEFWIYFNSISTTYLIYDTRPSGSNGWYPTIYFDASAGRINYYSSSAVRITGTVATPAGAWHHVALCRSSGSTRLFINGTQSGSTFTDSNSYLSTTGRPTIGADGNSLGANCLNGYIDDLRVTTVARYTSNFTPRAKAFPDIYNPYKTLPVSGAALWLDGADSSSLFTDAGVTPVKVNGDLVYQWNDKSGNSRHATQTTSGNRPTWVPPAIGRNGLGALAFNGSSQNFTITNNAAFNFGTGDFTIEAWVNAASLSNDWFIASAANNGGLFFGYTQSVSPYGWGIGRNGIAWDYVTGSTASINTWYHVAVCRSGTSVRIFVNGNQVGTTGTNSQSYNLSANSMTVGSQATSFYLNGKIQNLLIYKGQALYTANFTPWMS